MKSTNKNIAFFLPTFPPLPLGGAEQQAFKLAVELRKYNYNIFLITMGASMSQKHQIIDGIEVYRLPPLFRLFRREKIEKGMLDYDRKKATTLVELHSSKGKTYPDDKVNIKWFFSQFFILIKIVRFLFKNHKKFNLIYIPTIFEYALPVALASRIFKKKVIIKDSTLDGIIKMHNNLFPRLARRFIVKNCFFVAMTEAIYKNIHSVNVQPSKIFRIPNGINSISFKREPNSLNYSCLFVGNLTQQPAKGIDILLLGWKDVVKKYPMAKLTVVGRGNTNAYFDFVKELNIEKTVNFEGHTDPKHFYKACNVFILPSRREGMSNALLEAMIYSMPIVATDISGNQDLIKTLDNGILVPVDKPAAISKAIIYLFEHWDEAIGMGKKAREIVLTKCRMDIVASQYHDMFTSILSK